MPKNQRKKLKRPNGQGTVYKLKGRRRKPWIARITVGWSDKGKQLFQTIGYFETETEAGQALLKHQLNPVSPKANITLGELYKEWSESRYKHISKATIATYKGAWNYLATYENEKFSELRKTHYQQIIDENLNKSRSLLEKIKALAVMLYKHAMDEDIVDKNYAENIILPKAEKKDKEIFSDFEIKKMFDNSDMEWVDTILMLIFTGLRISEFLNLTKFNVDLKTGIIIGGMKTDAGTDRLIPIHEKIMPFVQKWYNKNGDRLICDSEGKRILPKYYRENLYFPALKRLDIRPLNPHRCRHTFASIMKKAGADELSIKKIMGHTSYKFTEKVYTHTEIEQLKQAVGKI